jgi:long-chain acyl-CoA synthetase
VDPRPVVDCGLVSGEDDSVREYTSPALVPADPRANLTDAVVSSAMSTPHRVALRRQVDGAWADVTSSQFRDQVVSLAKGLLAAGIGTGDRIGLICRTRYEWTLFDYAIWFAGAVTVPIYETSSAEQVAWILADSGAIGCVVESERHQGTVTQVRDRLPGLAQLWTIDSGAVAALTGQGHHVTDDQIEQRRQSLTADSVATIIYTSGTTGRPKGCLLSHGNFVQLAANARPMIAEVLASGEPSTLLFLPLAHVFARFVQVLTLSSGIQLGHTPDVKNLLGDLAVFRPTFLLAVPRVFEKIYNSAEAKAEAGGKGKIFARAAQTAIAYSEALDAGSVPLALRARHALFDRLVYSKLRVATGGNVAMALSGGAPLGPRLGHFFRGIGITIYEGWGLTETTAPATVNLPGALRIGTVGRPLPGVGVRVGDDGELLVKGVNVMHGYFHNEEATREALQDGWFHTGDLGEIDADGFVRITGRKKEIIVTAGGKNVAPMVLEDRLRGHPLVSQCLVVGDRRPFIACLVTLDQEMLPTWLANSGRAPLDPPAAAEDALVRAEIQRAVDYANELVSNAEAIKKFRILGVDFTEEAGHLTPKLSLKRHVVMKEFADDVESLYL